MPDVEGLIVPPTTPFDESMLVDERALAAHLGFLGEHGVKRILLNGTTAEFFSLMPEERRSLLKVARRNFDGLILYNTASDSLLQSLDTLKWAEAEGADAIVAMLPYYYADAPEEGLLDYLKTLSESTNLPVIFYNFTKHTNNPITRTMLKAVDHFAIKDSSGDFSLIGSTPCYLAGTSSRILEAYKAGAKGFVSSIANFIPETYVRLEELLKSGDFSRVECLQNEINTIRAKMTASNEIAGIKKELSRLIKGYPARVRLPLVE
ncbi:MAG: dihydrodipicolinate synthase family protein [Proteobacteria bacterium]|nr:dihydrodipicolinate synthase family protein [Pseudomonadota bacterium]